jgi:REP element-mobilizing transposase RayT
MRCCHQSGMKHNPEKHEFGQIVRSYWLKLPRYHSQLKLDAFVVMPNHVHGILVLTDNLVAIVLKVKRK